MDRTLEARVMLGLIEDRITAAIEAWEGEQEEMFFQSLQLAAEAIATLLEMRGKIWP